MLVKCVHARAGALPADYWEYRGFSEETPFPLTPGRVYLVCAIAFRSDQVWFFIHDDDDLPWPIQYPAPAFSIVDARPSVHWRFRLTQGHADHYAILAMEPWAQDDHFYDRLTDGAERELTLFRQAKRAMEFEAGVAGAA
jgi:hypothetical protein